MKPFFNRFSCSTALICVVALTSIANSQQAAVEIAAAANPVDSIQDWTQWRGPNRDGKVKGNWPEKLDESSLTKKWSVPMGPSYSGPIVVGDKVFVTETKDRKYEVVKALDRKSGKEIWSHQWEGSMTVPFFAKANGDWIRATPIYDEGRLFISGIKDVLVCVDAENGKEIWRVDLGQRYGSGTPSFGAVCSPMIDGDFLYIQGGGGFCKINKKSGETIWRSYTNGGGMTGGSFSSPIITTLSEKRQAVIQARDSIAGIDLEKGTTLWSMAVPSFRAMNILTPTAYKDGIFLSTYGGTSQFINVSKAGSSMQLSKKWEAGKQGYMSSPVVVDGHAYLNMKNKTIACFDLEKGGEKWSSPRYGKYASFVTNGKKILALDETGVLILFNANPEKYDLLDSRKISDNTWAHLGIRGNQLFVRELNRMTVYDWEPSTSN